MNRPPASLDAIDSKRLQFVADTVPALLAYLDDGVRYVWVNEAYRRWFGRSPESICGHHAREIVGEAAWTAVQHHVTRALAGEEVSYEARVDFAPGHTRDVRVAYVPDRDADGRVRGFVSLVTDISEMQTTERALRESERMLADSQIAARVGSWEAILNEDGSRRSVCWSDETYRIFGYEPGGVAVDYGLIVSLIHPDDRSFLQRTANPGAGPDDRFEIEFRIVRPDGGVRMIHAWITIERDAARRATRLHGTCQDITERKLAETETRLAREHLQVVVDATPALIARYDRDLRLIWANKNYATRFGKQPEEFVGKHLSAIVGESAYASIEPETARVVAGESIDIEIEVPYPVLGPRRMHFVVSPTFDAAGTVDGCVAVITDNTHLRKLEIERAHALAELKESDRRKDEFLAMLSHELRNPMAPIVTAVEILRLAPSDAEASAARAVIERQVGHMKRLLDDLLDVSRVSQGKIALRHERLDLGTILQRAVEVSQPLIAEKRLRLSMNDASGAIVLDADPARLVQVFGNLLNNAAKYSEPGGAIEIETAVEHGEAVVRVRDQGVGMTPDLIERAFDLFVQDTRSLDRAQGGIGIGLTMVRSLVKLHGGSVQAFSDGPGRGSEIVVRLPRVRAGAGADVGADLGDGRPLAGRDRPRPAIATTPTPTPTSRPLRVLVVDDNVDAATTLARLLTLLGHEVAVAHDGPGALATAPGMRPDIVFVDIGLPGMDGYALATALRAAGLDRAELVAVTGYGRVEDVQRSRDGGFAHHIVKPANLAQLRRITEHREGF